MIRDCIVPCKDLGHSLLAFARLTYGCQV
jgi:hypothetical protein